MNYLPGIERIIDEALEVFSLANAQHVGNRTEAKFVTHPYIKQELEARSSRLIIEKLLAIAIKLRFLDDQCQIIKENDRKNSGQISKEEKVEEVGLREALNKIIHHKSINLIPRKTRVRVSEEYGNDEGFIKIAPGVYECVSIYVVANGMQGKAEWVFNTELNHLINEILMVLYRATNQGKVKKEGNPL